MATVKKTPKKTKELTASFHARFDAVLADCAQKAEANGPYSLPMSIKPQINPRLSRSLGRALVTERARPGRRGAGWIEVSTNALYWTTERGMDQLLRHEIAHVFANHHWGRRCGHDSYWRTMMFAVGARHASRVVLPEDLIDSCAYDREVLGVARGDCLGCSATLSLSRASATAILKGRKAGSCRLCSTYVHREWILANSTLGGAK